MAIRYIDDSPDKEKTIDTKATFKIITDEPAEDASDFRKYSTQLSTLIINSPPRFTVGIYGGWGTGKTTLMEMIKKEIDEKYSDRVETIWFDSWRYEREQYSAMIPLLRTIILSLTDSLSRVEHTGSTNRKAQVLKDVTEKLSKILGAVVRNMTIEASINAATVQGGTTFDLNKIIDDYKSDGSFILGQERIYFHKHMSEHLKEHLKKIRDIVKYDFRLVIFVDDLDRCTPEKSLELLESIKTFFDIEGIIYVIAIDPRSIDSVIKSKYGNDAKLFGTHYLQKIIQLPFQIPMWGSQDLSNTIKGIISKSNIPGIEMDKISTETNIGLIIKAAQLNPRDIKRFINSIVLSRHVYEEIRDIEKLIAVQAFYFRGNDWLNFLKLIIQYENRVEFLKYFILYSEKENGVSSLEDFENKLDEKKYFDIGKPILNIFRKIIELKDDDLFLFLKTSARILLKIEDIDKYLRAVEAIYITNTSSNYDVDGKESHQRKLLDLIKNGNITKFKQLLDNRENGATFHFPCENLSKLELDGINLSDTFLAHSNLSGCSMKGAVMTKADLTGADLTGADLTGASLAGADLTGADLTGASLAGADLSQSKLVEADLTGADLTSANLFRATLFGANLFQATLLEANLYQANFSRANLSGSKLRGVSFEETNLSYANLESADLSKAILSGADLSNANLKRVNLSEADISDSFLSESNLSYSYLISIDKFLQSEVDRTIFSHAIIDNPQLIKYLIKNNTIKNIPEPIKSKKELKEILQRRRSLEERTEEFLKITKLPN